LAAFEVASDRILGKHARTYVRSAQLSNLLPRSTSMMLTFLQKPFICKLLSSVF